MKKGLSFQLEFKKSRYEIRVEVDYHIDANYGADADGNNGEVRLMLDHLHCINVHNIFTKVNIKPNEELQAAIWDLAYEKLCNS